MSASALSGEDRHLFEFLAQGRLLVAIIFFGMVKTLRIQLLSQARRAPNVFSLKARQAN